MRCVLGEGRSYLEALFKWFRKLSLDSTTRDAAPVVLSPDEKARVESMLQLDPLCAPKTEWNPLFATGLARFFAENEDNRTVAAALGECAVVQPSMGCPAPEVNSASCISSSWLSFRASWLELLSRTGLVDNIRPVLRIPIGVPGESVTCTIHAENAAATSSSTGSILVAVAYERGSAWVCDILRFTCNSDGTVAAEHARAVLPDDCTHVHSCCVYGHVSVAWIFRKTRVLLCCRLNIIPRA
jgi:hypothetical protein